MCTFLVEHYPQFNLVFKRIFSFEYQEFIKPHLSVDVYKKYLIKPEVQKLLIED
jgi:hypothetical protein